MGKTCDGTNSSRFCFFRQFKFRSGINADLVGFFLPDFFPCCHISLACGKKVFHLQGSASDFHIGKAVSLLVPCNLVHLGTEGLRVKGIGCIVLKSADEIFHAAHFQRRTKIAGENFALNDQPSDFFRAHLALFQIFFQKMLIAHSQAFPEFFPVLCFCVENFVGVLPRAAARICFFLNLCFDIRGTKVQTVFAQAFPQFCQKSLLVGSVLIHFVDKNKSWNLVSFQKSPQRYSMSLHAVCSVDHQNGVI